MKMFLLVVISITFVFSTCHAQKNRNEGIEIEQDSVEFGWPKDINGLIEHLNSWNKDELDAYERPDVYPNFITSGETNTWIELHKEFLKALGTTVVWKKEKMKYELKIN